MKVVVWALGFGVLELWVGGLSFTISVLVQDLSVRGFGGSFEVLLGLMGFSI